MVTISHYINNNQQQTMIVDHDFDSDIGYKECTSNITKSQRTHPTHPAAQTQLLNILSQFVPAYDQ